MGEMRFENANEFKKAIKMSEKNLFKAYHASAGTKTKLAISSVNSDLEIKEQHDSILKTNLGK